MRCCNNCTKCDICTSRKYNRREIIQLGARDISEVCKDFQDKSETIGRGDDDDMKW